MQQKSFVAESTDAGTRLDLFLAERTPSLSRSRIKELIRDGQCLVDGKVELRSDLRLKEGQKAVLIASEERTSLKEDHGPVEILYRDSDLCVVNKAPGLTVHPCPSHQGETLIGRLLAHFPELARMEGMRPGIVHRIDKDTSGLMVVALQEKSRLRLTELFSNRLIKKEYLALVSGMPQESGHIDAPIGRDPKVKVKMAVLPQRLGGRTASTDWKRLWVAEDKSASLLAVQIHTGRTHQIRVHMREIGHPLLGDSLYAPREIAARAPRQMLHAFALSFPHPATGKEISFRAEVPEDMRETTFSCAHSLQKVVITGNPGSGKSTVTDFFRERQLPHFSADEEIQKLYAPKGLVAAWLSDHGGRKLIDQSGAIDRKALFQAFQRQSVFKREMEEMLHAAVFEALERFWQDNAREDRAVAEIPLYFECGRIDPQVITVFVRCPQRMRFERLSKTRGWSEEKALTIESWQWDERRKERACRLVLDNEGTREDLNIALRKLDEKLKEIERARLGAEKEKLVRIFKGI